MTKRKETVSPLKFSPHSLRSRPVRMATRPRDPVQFGTVFQVQEKALKPVVPLDQGKKDRLRKTLTLMGCAPLLDLPWGFLSEEFVREVATSSIPPEFQGTVQAFPPKWTSDFIASAFGLDLAGEGILPKSENLTKPFFFGEMDPKDGWKLSQCGDEDLRAVISFLLPILSPHKPRRLTLRICSTLVGAFIGQKIVSWPKVLEEIISIQVKSLHLKAPTSLSCYLVHLYSHGKVLTKKEQENYAGLLYLAQMGDPDADGEAGFDTPTEDAETPKGKLPRKRRLDPESNPNADPESRPDGHPKARLESHPDPDLRPGQRATVKFLPSMELVQAETWISSAKAKVKNLESLVGIIAGKLECSTPAILAVMDQVLERGSKEKADQVKAEMDRAKQHIADLEVELAEAKSKVAFKEEWERKLDSAIADLEPVLKLSALDLTKANLVEQYLASAPTALLSRVVACNNHFASKVEESFVSMRTYIEDMKAAFQETALEEEESEEEDPVDDSPV
ncbi:unnamed protein product [Calypogeia fissa]